MSIRRNSGKKIYYFLKVNGNQMQKTTNMIDRIQLVNIKQGEMQVEINSKIFCLTSTNFAFLPPHSSISVINHTDDFEAEVIGFTMALQDIVLQKLGHGFFSYVFKTMVWKLSDKGKQTINAYCTIYASHCNMPSDIYSVEIANSLFNIFLLSFYQSVKDRFTEDNSITINSKSLAARFAFLLHDNFKQHHTVAFYADKLCVSSKYLTQIFKANTGFTPKAAIDRVLGMEALFMLGNTAFNIQEISIQLGFPDQSYFGRFFKRLFGLSPLAYRTKPNLKLIERLREENLRMNKAMGNK